MLPVAPGSQGRLERNTTSFALSCHEFLDKCIYTCICICICIYVYIIPSEQCVCLFIAFYIFCHVHGSVTSTQGTLTIKWVLELHFIHVNPPHCIDTHSPGIICIYIYIFFFFGGGFFPNALRRVPVYSWGSGGWSCVRVTCVVCRRLSSFVVVVASQIRCHCDLQDNDMSRKKREAFRCTGAAFCEICRLLRSSIGISVWRVVFLMWPCHWDLRFRVWHRSSVFVTSLS